MRNWDADAIINDNLSYWLSGYAMLNNPPIPGPSRGLLRDSEIFVNLCLTFVSGYNSDCCSLDASQFLWKIIIVL